MCAVCRHPSNVFDPFLDLCLDVQGADSIEGALQLLTRRETLNADNLYTCAKYVGCPVYHTHCISNPLKKKG